MLKLPLNSNRNTWRLARKDTYDFPGRHLDGVSTLFENGGGNVEVKMRAEIS